MKTVVWAWGFFALISFFTASSGMATAEKAVTALDPVEIRQYQGENLSAISDFQENSVAGPQKVQLDTYRLRITGLVDHPLTLTYAQVLKYQHHSKVVTLN